MLTPSQKRQAEEILRRISPGIPDTDLSALVTSMTCTKVPARFRFLEEGEICRFIGLLAKGVIRHYYLSENGDEATRWVVLPGEFFSGLSSFALQKPSTEVLETVSASQVFLIDRKDWLRIVAHSHYLQAAYTAYLEQTYAGIEDRLFYMMARPAEVRLDHFLMLRPGIDQLIPLKFLASMVGITPQHLSRLRNKAK